MITSLYLGKKSGIILSKQLKHSGGFAQSSFFIFAKSRASGSLWFLAYNDNTCYYLHITSSLSLMDRMLVCGTGDAGSIPAGSTTKTPQNGRNAQQHFHPVRLPQHDVEGYCVHPLAACLLEE